MVRIAILVFVALAVAVIIFFAIRGAQAVEPVIPDDTSYVPPGTEGTTTAFTGGRTSEATFQDIPVVMTDKICHNSFQGTITCDLRPDGQAYLVNTSIQRGGRKYMGFAVYDNEGALLWDHAFTNTNRRSEKASFYAGGKAIAAEATDYDEAGEFQLLDDTGGSLMNRAVEAWNQPVVSADGSWLALFNEVNRTLLLFGPPNYTLAWSASLSQGANGTFIGNGPLFLLCQSGQAGLFNASGKQVWKAAIPDSGHWNVVVSPDERFIAATTPDPDSSVYLYSVDGGALVWSQFLVAGGNKGLTFSPDGSSLVVYDVGQHGDIYMLKADSGEILWRFRLQGREDATVTVEDLQFSSSGQAMFADIVELTATNDAYLYYHYLLALTPDCRALWVSPLGAEVDVDLAAGPGLALVTTNNIMDINGNVTNSVTLVSYDPEPATGTPGAGGP